MTATEIGIVGYGQMGRFVAQLLAPRHRVVAYDPASPHAEGTEGAATRVKLEEAASRPTVFLFPPIPRIAECCEMIRPHVAKGAVIVEGCSVMCHPTQEMLRRLPANVELVGCHPLFGPQSGAGGVAGFKVVLAAVRTERLAYVASLFRPLGLEIVVMSPEQHDRAMARTQALEQLLGRLLLRLEVGPELIDVPGYRKLVELKQMLEHDSEELFQAVHHYNPFATEIRQRVQRTLTALTTNLEPGA